MGYRSQVNSLIYGPTEKVMAFLVAYRLKQPPVNVLEEFKTDITIQACGENSYLLLDAQNVKWYDEYEDVVAWNAFMEDAKELGLEVEFARVGEDYNDVVIDGTPVCEQRLGYECLLRVDLPGEGSTLTEWIAKNKLTGDTK